MKGLVGMLIKSRGVIEGFENAPPWKILSQ